MPKKQTKINGWIIVGKYKKHTNYLYLTKKHAKHDYDFFCDDSAMIKQVEIIIKD